ncbi:MAG: isoprenoid biosynthesis glyoxalase ElbB [Bdellovibrionales bacterium]|nr:isoprenoid biosynthesis glyoxalase ElbB [Bdellovibrionales bacterium]
MKKIAVVLSGCGHLDGAEITESVSTLITLSQLGADYQCFAPDREFPSVHHINKEPGSPRNALAEAARICRGKVASLSRLKAEKFDGLVFPGGFGAALNLSDWGKNGSKGSVDPEVSALISEFHQQSKPICAICIAPTLIAKVLGDYSPHLTIGDDPEDAAEIQKTGAEHVACKVNDFVTDRENKIVTTPAYMFDAKPHEVFTGIQSALKEFYEMA